MFPLRSGAAAVISKCRLLRRTMCRELRGVCVATCVTRLCDEKIYWVPEIAPTVRERRQYSTVQYNALPTAARPRIAPRGRRPVFPPLFKKLRFMISARRSLSSAL